MIPGMYRVGEWMCVHNHVSPTNVTVRIGNGQVKCLIKCGTLSL